MLFNNMYILKTSYSNSCNFEYYVIKLNMPNITFQHTKKETSMDINKLIEKGYSAYTNCYHKSNMGPSYISGEEYEKWIQLSIRFLEEKFPNETFTIDFKETGCKANGNGKDRFYTLIGILEALRDIPPTVSKSEDIDWVLEKICTNFNKAAKALLNRRRDGGNPRSTIEIRDEYDVQDLMYPHNIRDTKSVANHIYTLSLYVYQISSMNFSP